MDTMVSVRTSSAAPVRAGGVTVTPLARSLAVRLPFGAGFVWNRPRALLVEREGRVERVRVVDVTRAVQLGILVSTAVAVAAIAVLSRRKE
jgi:hypothetical protein